MKEALAVVGVLVGTIVAFTILGGGNINLGTSASGPYLNFGFKGPRSA